MSSLMQKMPLNIRIFNARYTVIAGVEDYRSDRVQVKYPAALGVEAETVEREHEGKKQSAKKITLSFTPIAFAHPRMDLYNAGIAGSVPVPDAVKDAYLRYVELIEKIDVMAILGMEPVKVVLQSDWVDNAAE